MSDEPVFIKTFINEIEAKIARSYLESEGIKAFVFKDDEGGMYPGLQTSTGVRLGVSKIDSKHAEQLLTSMETSTGVIESQPPSENLISMYSLAAWILFIGGIALLLAGLTVSTPFIFIGIPVAISGVILEVFSRKKMKEVVNQSK